MILFSQIPISDVLSVDEKPAFLPPATRGWTSLPLNMILKVLMHTEKGMELIREIEATGGSRRKQEEC